AREVPEDVTSIALNDLPLLAMEYCAKGDLRKVMHVLDMTSAQLHSMVLGIEESFLSLQLRLEAQTQAHISPESQELLMETGNSLDPRWAPVQCLPDGLVRDTNRSHM
ncbi:hypothetical protein XENOCAPTIV_018065, partial [Xenoophorus captivus]